MCSQKKVRNRVHGFTFACGAFWFCRVPHGHVVAGGHANEGLCPCFCDCESPLSQIQEHQKHHSAFFLCFRIEKHAPHKCFLFTYSWHSSVRKTGNEQDTASLCMQAAPQKSAEHLRGASDDPLICLLHSLFCCHT
jgi:hypothetical protein